MTKKSSPRKEPCPKSKKKIQSPNILMVGGGKSTNKVKKKNYASKIYIKTKEKISSFKPWGQDKKGLISLNFYTIRFL